MSRLAASPRKIKYLVVASAATLVTGVATPSHAFITRRNYYRAKHAAQRLAKDTHTIMKGTLVDGPKHTLHAIRDKPVDFGVKILIVGVAGGAMKKFGVDPAPYAISASAFSLALQLWKSTPMVRSLTGDAKLRSIGENYVWPSALGIGSTVGGELMGHGNPHPVHAVSYAEATKAGVQTVIIAGDVPLVLQTAFSGKKDDKH